jgi:hypothetical protein
MSTLAIPAASKPMHKPEDILTPAARESIAEEARTVLANIHDEDAKKELLAVGRKTSDIGMRAQSQTKTRLNTLLKDDPGKAAIMGDLQSMNVAIENLNPDRYANLGIFGSLLAMIRGNKLMMQVRQVAKGYETVESQISSIEDALAEGGKILRLANDEHGKVIQFLDDQKRDFAKKLVLFGEVARGLQEKKSDPTFEADRNFENQVVNTVRDLQVMYAANHYFTEAFEVVSTQNDRLIECVSRTSTVVGNVARGALLLRKSLLEQRRVLDINQKSRQLTETLMVDSANMLAENSVGIEEAANSPVLSLEKVRMAYGQLCNTLQEIERVKQNSDIEALQTLDNLDRVAEDLKKLQISMPVGESKPEKAAQASPVVEEVPG